MLPSPPLLVMMLPFGASTMPSGSLRWPPAVRTVPPFAARAKARARRASDEARRGVKAAFSALQGLGEDQVGALGSGRADGALA
jgi:hypothetical protein